jgi:hypothetical protein
VNPDLVKAARALVAFRQQNPDATEDEVRQITAHYGQKAEDVSAYLKKLDADHGNLVASGLKGFTANFADELVGALPKALGGGEAGSEEMKLRQTLANQEHPVGSRAIELAGGIGSAALTGGLAPELQVGGRVANAAATAAAAGGAYGAISGAGAGETASERLHKGITEGLVGAGLGGALGAGAGALAELSPVAKALRLQLAAIEESGGYKALKQTLQQFRDAGRGKEVMTLDLSKPLQQLGDYAATGNPRVYNAAAEKLNARQPDITERILGDVEDIKGKPLPDAVAKAEQLKSEKYDWANTAYGNLRNVQMNVPEDAVSKIVQAPTIQHLLDQASLADDMKAGSPLQALLKRLQSTGKPTSPEDLAAVKSLANGETPALAQRPLTFNDLHQLERALDGKVGMAYTKGNVPLADAYKGVRNQVRDLLTKVSPDYANVTEEYAAKSQLQEMLTKGVETWNKIGVRDLTNDLAKLSPDDAETFRYGLASKLVDTLRDAKTNRSVAKNIMDGGLSMQEKLKVIFGSPQKFDEFMSRVHAEKTMGESRGVIGGSPTAKRLMDATYDPKFDPIPSLHSFMYSPHAGLARIIGTLTGNAEQKMTQRTTQTIGNSMFTQGADKVDALLRKLAEPVNVLGHHKAASIGAGAGVLTNLFGNQ